METHVLLHGRRFDQRLLQFLKQFIGPAKNSGEVEDLKSFKRIVLWLFALLALSAWLLFMVQTSHPWGYASVQTLYIFTSVPLFAGVYTLWLLLLLLLLRRTQSVSLGAVLVILFTLVYAGTTVVATHFGAGEDWIRAIDEPIFQGTGSLSYYTGYDYPGLAILEAFVANITGMNFLLFRTPLALILLVDLSLLLFVGCYRLFKNVPLAALAAIFAIQSNMFMSRFYLHPLYMGIVLFITFWSILLGREQRLGQGETILLFIVIFAVTVTHFVSSLVVVIILAGLYIEQRWRKLPDMVSINLVIFSMILVLVWWMYQATQTFFSMSRLFLDLVDRLGGGSAFYYIGVVTAANIRGMPLWVTAVQTFWWITIYLGGAGVALRSLISKAKKSSQTWSHAGAYLLLAVIVVGGAIVSTGGYEFYRFIVYGSFLAAPLVITYLISRWRSSILTLVAFGILLTLSFPSLLAHNTNISVSSTHLSEIVAAQFLSRASEGREDNILLYEAGITGPVLHYSPKLTYNLLNFGKQGADIMNVEELPGLWESYAGSFRHRKDTLQEAFFIFSYKSILYYNHLFGLSVDDPMWSQVDQNLTQTDLVYNAGHVQIYRVGPPSR